MNSHSQRIIASFLIVLTLNLSVGCNYFRVHSFDNPAIATHEIDENYYIIIHMSSGQLYHLDHLAINTDEKITTGIKKKITPEHQQSGWVERGVLNRYNPRISPHGEEVHVYTSKHVLTDGLTLIAFEDISRFEIYDRALGVTIAQYFGVAAALVALPFVVILMTSCPFIYTLEGNDYDFRGEIYGGAIAPNLERDDYMPLPHFIPQNETFTMKITNELQERQYTDVAELLLVEHPKGVEVLMDSYGNPYILANPIAPMSAETSSGGDYLAAVTTQDGIAYQFTDEAITNEDFSDLDLTFEANNSASQAKLILNLKNTIWMDYIFERFCALFGDGYDRFSESQKNKDPENKIQWAQDEGIMLEVKMKTKSGWETVDHINMVGPLAARSIVVPIELDCKAGDKLEIRLESGYHFWEVDYAAMDFSENEALKITPLPLLKAVDENGVDVMSDIVRQDGNYLEQPYVGAEAFLTFESLPMQEGHATSLFLHTSGYYEYIRNYAGKPDISELKKFRTPGTFAHFSKSRFSQMAGLKN